MRIINIESYNEDTMVLATPVYDSMKRVLLAAGRSIHPTYLEKLKEMNISFLIIEDSESIGITLEEMVDMPTWIEMIKVIEDVYKEGNATKRISIPLVKKIQEIAGKLVYEVSHRRIIVLAPTSAATLELMPYAHIVNVTLLSLLLGKELNYTMIQLRDLAIGALLHDIGKSDEAEYAKHPEIGFEIIRAVREFNIISAHVAFQHHEALDGSGFPRKIKDSNFLEFAQVCGVANLYENLISKQLVAPHDALEIVMTKSENTYSHAVVQAFFNGVPSYPPGTKVILNNGQSGIVYKIDKNIHRPTVRLLSSMEEVSLSEDPTLMIKEVLTAK